MNVMHLECSVWHIVNTQHLLSVMVMMMMMLMMMMMEDVNINAIQSYETR